MRVSWAVWSLFQVGALGMTELLKNGRSRARSIRLSFYLR